MALIGLEGWQKPVEVYYYEVQALGLDPYVRCIALLMILIHNIFASQRKGVWSALMMLAR